MSISGLTADAMPRCKIVFNESPPSVPGTQFTLDHDPNKKGPPNWQAFSNILRDSAYSCSITSSEASKLVVTR